MSEADWDLVGYVSASTHRQHVLAALTDHPRTPSGIVEHTPERIQLSHVSRTIIDLRERGLVELLVDEGTRKGRIYALSGEGREVLGEVRDRGMLDSEVTTA